MQVPADQCGLTCVHTRGCTHFAWTDFEGGTCWMKNGPAQKSDAHPTNNPDMVCGIIRTSIISLN